MVTGLADILRYSLASDRNDTVTLAEELDAVDEYLNLERVRFEERLHVERAVEPSALQARIPPMLVQTLVENAVKHGIAGLKAGGVIRLDARVRADRLEVAVRNSGRFLPPTPDSGHGLRNASERLALLYGGAASLRVAGTDGDETVASLTLPLAIPPEPLKRRSPGGA
jgi:LytS/YehU family sensor histidine kinase